MGPHSGNVFQCLRPSAVFVAVKSSGGLELMPPAECAAVRVSWALCPRVKSVSLAGRALIVVFGTCLCNPQVRACGRPSSGGLELMPLAGCAAVSVVAYTSRGFCAVAVAFKNNIFSPLDPNYPPGLTSR